jgi:Zn-dependent protease
VKILGIPTKVEGSFFVLSFFLAASRGQNLSLLLEWMLVVLVSVLLHELGHALVARTFGLSPSIKLYSMGGLTSWDSALTLTPLKHLLISLAGPAAGFLFGGIVFVAGPAVLGSSPSQLLAVAYSDLLFVNLGWGIFNLLPMLPLDGGQVLLTLEEWISKSKSRLVSHVISLMVALGITYLALSSRSMWIAILGVWFVYTNGNALVQKLQTYRDQKIRPLLEQARDALTRSEFDKALVLTRQAQKEARTTSVRSEAAQLLIFILVHQHQFKEAEEEIIKFNGVFGEDAYLKGLFYFQKEEMATAIPHLKIAFDQSATEQLGMILYQAFINEKSYVEALELCGHPELSDVSWKLYVNLQNEAFARGESRVAAQAGSLAFEKQPDPNVAYNIACSLAHDSEITKACEWLERAIDSGFNDKDLLATDPDLDSLRQSPAFAALLAKM